VELLAQHFCAFTGGATAIPGKGFWISDANSELIQEHVTVLSFSVDISLQVKREVQRVARWLARDLQQEAVFVKINHLSFLVRPYTIMYQI